MKRISIFIFLALCFFNLVAQTSKEQQLDSLADKVFIDFRDELEQLGPKRDVLLTYSDSCSGTVYTCDKESLSATFKDKSNVQIFKRTTEEKSEYLLFATKGGTTQIFDISNQDYILLLLEEMQRFAPQITLVELIKQKGAKVRKAGTKITYNGNGYKIVYKKIGNGFKISSSQKTKSFVLKKIGDIYYYNNKVANRCLFNGAINKLCLFIVNN